MIINQWNQAVGLTVLEQLAVLCRSLVWECTVLLALCTPGHIPEDSSFGLDDIRRLVPDFDRKSATVWTKTTATTEDDDGTSSASATATSERKDDNEPANGAVLEELMELDNDGTKTESAKESTGGAGGAGDGGTASKVSPQLATLIKHIKPLLSIASRLGRSLSEFFTVLVKLFVLPQHHRQRRHYQSFVPPKEPSWQCVGLLTKMLVDGLTWDSPAVTPTPGIRYVSPITISLSLSIDFLSL